MNPMKGVALLGALGVAATAAGAVGTVLYLQEQGVAPRTLAPYVERRSAGHNPMITDSGQWLGASLRTVDRGAGLPLLLPPLRAGAQEQPAQGKGGALKDVDSNGALLRAMAAAVPGDVITLAPGTYRFNHAINASRSGVAGVPVTVRAAQSGTVIIEFSTIEGFVVRAPHWRFENLTIRGVCGNHNYCEHAFHVVGGATHFAALNNTILDFNAHFKINGKDGVFPDHGLLESNTLSNSAPRRTGNPVTPVDLVGASDWTIRANLITDFIKVGGDRVSYGAFAKGAGARTVFERNVVWCEARLRGQPGQRVGLSLGGGGTEKPYCRDRKCVNEQQDGIVRDNLVASCSDVGIYLNSASGSRVEHNTLVDTVGIDVRYPASSATVEGNLVDGPIRSRDDGVLRLGDNRSTALGWSYVGRHPVRALFRDWEAGDLAWSDEAPRRAGAVERPDLCGQKRAVAPAYGAFEDFAACVTTSSSRPAN
ncbi:right-handed parallel beta-helix repeat-containing protein [Massilia sp.]|uniref:right-handed parallel beta-helix repeat-containing protein n=1 Tax=Massilia sp. TaxID=1882437 RepID=UPI0028A1688A|nr:right-handed parallel beta-helix repeat-containing protein [Massilia sp.]